MENLENSYIQKNNLVIFEHLVYISRAYISIPRAERRVSQYFDERCDAACITPKRGTSLDFQHIREEGRKRDRESVNDARTWRAPRQVRFFAREYIYEAANAAMLGVIRRSSLFSSKGAKSQSRMMVIDRSLARTSTSVMGVGKGCRRDRCSRGQGGLGKSL